MSTTDQGNAFRDTVRDFLRSAGYVAETEVMLAGKKVDVFAQRRMFGSMERIAIETKDYTQNVPLPEVQDFVNAYANIVRAGEADRGLMVSRGDITSQGRLAIESARRDRLLHLTWQEFQREIFGPDDYLRALIEEHARSGVNDFYIPPKTADGEDLMGCVERWLNEPTPPPLVVLGGYGTGKSTFSQTLAYWMAERSINNPEARIPILVRLGDLSEENRLDGLFGSLLASRYRVSVYHYDLLLALNRAGRLLIIFDGLDEMKHGMTFATFKREVTRILDLHEGDARLILLGRPNAFPNEQAFRSVIKGRAVGATGDEFRVPNRPDCRDIEIGAWTDGDASLFVERYLAYLGHVNHLSDEAIASKVQELAHSRFQSLIRRPVHAQMLCQVAIANELALGEIDEFRLYDLFVTLLLEREVAKPGRYPAFDVPARRRFNASVSWWLLTQYGAVGASLDSIPIRLCRAAVGGIEHEFDDDGLRQELVAGCLVEKGGGRVYFGHRSIQEFLAAEYLFATEMGSLDGAGKNAVLDAATHATEEVADFLGQFFERHQDGLQRARRVCDLVADYKSDLPFDLAPFKEAYRAANADVANNPWLFLLRIQGNTKEWDGSAVGRLIEVIGRKDTPKELWLMAVQAIALLRTPEAIQRRHEIAAAIISRTELAGYVGRSQGGQITIDVKWDDYSTTCLLSAVSTNTDTEGTGRIEWDWDALRLAAHRLLGFGPQAEEPREKVRLNLAQIYSALGWNTAALDRIRPFFRRPASLRSIRGAPEVYEVKRRPVAPATTLIRRDRNST